MPVQIESITPRDGFLEVILRGISERNDFVNFLPTVREALTSRRLETVLIDCSNIVYTTSVIHEHDFAEYLAREFARPAKLAFLAPWSPDHQRPHIETAARNRGVNLLVFQKREDAVCWIQSSNQEDQSGSSSSSKNCCEPEL